VDDVPILLAVSPFATIRSAPTTTASTLPERIKAAAIESVIKVAGMPSSTSSVAVSRPPYTSDRCLARVKTHSIVSHRLAGTHLIVRSSLGAVSSLELGTRKERSNHAQGSAISYALDRERSLSLMAIIMEVDEGYQR